MVVILHVFHAPGKRYPFSCKGTKNRQHNNEKIRENIPFGILFYNFHYKKLIHSAYFLKFRYKKLFLSANCLYFHKQKVVQNGKQWG